MIFLSLLTLEIVYNVLNNRCCYRGSSTTSYPGPSNLRSWGVRSPGYDVQTCTLNGFQCLRFQAWKKNVVILKENYLIFNVNVMKEVLACENLKLNEMN